MILSVHSNMYHYNRIGYSLILYTNLDQPIPVTAAEKTWGANQKHGETRRGARETQEYCCSGIYT